MEIEMEMEMETNSWYCHDCFRYFEQGESVVCISEMKSVFCEKCGNDFPLEWTSTFKYVWDFRD